MFCLEIDDNSRRSKIFHVSPKCGSSSVENTSFFCYLQITVCFAEWISETERGRDMRVDHIYPWISRVERGGCLLWEITRQDKGGLFSPSSFKQPYSCYNSSSILVYSRGFNLHSGPVTCFANQFLSPLCGALSVPFYSIKLIRMSRLVLLICILNPREARDQGRMKPFALRQVVSRELEQICIYIYSYTNHLSTASMAPVHQYVIFIFHIRCW